MFPVRASEIVSAIAEVGSAGPADLLLRSKIAAAVPPPATARAPSVTPTMRPVFFFFGAGAAATGAAWVAGTGSAAGAADSVAGAAGWIGSDGLASRVEANSSPDFLSIIIP